MSFDLCTVYIALTLIDKLLTFGEQLFADYVKRCFGTQATENSWNLMTSHDRFRIKYICLRMGDRA